MTVTGTISYKEVMLTIEADATPYVPSTYEQPAEGGEFDIYSVKVGDIEIFDLLSAETIQEIAEQYTLKAF